MNRPAPALLTPGARVRFEADAVIEVLRTGGLATIQDRGRFGHSHLGVGRCGAADRGALALANRLVGNPADAAGIEVTFGGFALLALDAVTVALTGAACPSPLGWGAATTIRAGQVVELGPPATQLRSYLAVRGGIDVPPVLGSRSTDLLGGLGPDPLRPGTRLAIGRPTGTVSGEVAVPQPRPSSLLVVPGPRTDWFTDDALSQLIGQDWTVRADSNRIGVRLDGPPLTRTRERRAADRGDAARRPADTAERAADPAGPGCPGDRWLPGAGGAGRQPTRRRRAAASR